MRRLFTSLCCVLACGTLFAQDYPVKSVRIIVPFVTGGPADVYARPLALRLTESLGQTSSSTTDPLVAQ